MVEDELEDIDEIDDEAEEIEHYEDKQKEENIQKRNGQVGFKSKAGRPKGALGKKNLGPLGETLEPSSDSEQDEVNEDGVDTYEQSEKRKEDEANNPAPKAGEQEEVIPIIVVKELPVQQVPQREAIDENGRKVKFMTIEEVLTMLVNK